MAAPRKNTRTTTPSCWQEGFRSLILQKTVTTHDRPVCAVQATEPAHNRQPATGPLLPLLLLVVAVSLLPPTATSAPTDLVVHAGQLYSAVALVRVAAEEVVGSGMVLVIDSDPESCF